MNSNAGSPTRAVPSAGTAFDPAAKAGKVASAATAPVAAARIVNHVVRRLLCILSLLTRASAPTITLHGSRSKAADEPSDRSHRPRRDRAERPFRRGVLGRLPRRAVGDP